MSNDNDALMKALELAKGGDYETALIYVRRLLKRDPENRRAGVLRWTLEARLLEKRGAREEAIQRYQHILSMRPDMAEAKRKLDELTAAVAAASRRGAQPTAEGAETRDSDRPTAPPSVAARLVPPPAPEPTAGARNRPPPPPLPDRRQSPREVLDVEIGLHTDSNFYAGFSDDISEGGLFVATYNILPVGTRVRVSFALPSGQAIDTEVEVRWVRDPLQVDMETVPGMGVSFVSLTPPQRGAIEAFMRKRAPLFYDG